MRLWTKLLIPVLILGLVGVADAKGKGKGKKAHDLKGKITSVDANSITVSAGHKKGGAKTVTVTTDVQTKVFLDGASVPSIKNLSIGEKVTVSPSTGTALEIKATGKHHKKGKKKK